MDIPTGATKRERLFWSHVHEDEAGCWQFDGVMIRGGYRRFARKSAHRQAYEMVVGPIPDGLDLDHLCRVHGCVNPAHLEPVTNRENVLRGTGVTAEQARQTHCKNGHPLEGANLLPHALRRGHRNCRVCTNARVRLRYEQRVALGFLTYCAADRHAKCPTVDAVCVCACHRATESTKGGE